MHRIAKFITVSTLLTAHPGAATATEPTSIFKDTMAEISYVDLEKAAKGGAIALWALGSIEEHGPHLPLGTDAYIASAQLRSVREILKRSKVESVVVPPYYWAVNHVTGDFPGSFTVRPEIMTELIGDIFGGLAKAGFKDVYCTTGHFDAAHGKAIAEAVRRANATGSLRVHFVVPRRLGQRLELDATDRQFLLVDWPGGVATSATDLHAGADETSVMMAIAPDLVRDDVAKSLPDTNLSDVEVAEWRKGGPTARIITPRGYLGAPARASADEGWRQLREQSQAYAAAVLASVGRCGTADC